MNGSPRAGIAAVIALAFLKDETLVEAMEEVLLPSYNALSSFYPLYYLFVSSWSKLILKIYL